LNGRKLKVVRDLNYRLGKFLETFFIYLYSLMYINL